MKSAADLVQEHLLYMTTDLTQWRALYNENAVWEFAYASSAGLPGAARGIMEIAQRVEGFLARVEGLSFGDLKIYPIDRADAVFAEWYRPSLSPELCSLLTCRERRDRVWSRVLGSNKGGCGIFLRCSGGIAGA